jgi:putative oxidoreductase
LNKLFDSLMPYTALVGRLLIAAMFVLSGWGKISGYAGTQAYMQHAGVPGGLLPLVILLELGGGIAIIIGYLFHSGSPDQMQHIMFLKDVSIAGGFLFLTAYGAGPLSVDARLRGS